MKKIIHHRIIPIGLGLAAGLPAFAIEPPKDDAPPPPSVKEPTSAPAEDGRPEGTLRQRVAPAPKLTPPQAEENRTAPEERTAFIGIISAEVPELLAAHLGIGRGEGVLVRDVAPDSPAQKAGVEKYDVILRVAGKSVGSPAELSQQISAHKPDDEVSLDFIHKGAESSKTVKLEARPGPALARNGGRMPDTESWNLDGLRQDQADRVRDMIERRLQDMRAQQQQLEKDFDSMQLRRRGEPRDEGGIKGFHFKSDATFRLMDNDGSIEMKSSDGSKDITVRDRDNNEVWSGPWNTEDEKAAAPKDIRERIEKFKMDDNFRGNGFKFRFGPGLREEGETR